MIRYIALLTAIGLAACSTSAPAPHGKVGDYYPGSSGLVIGTTSGTAYDGGQGSALAAASLVGTASTASAVTAAVISVPVAGTAPTGATQITTGRVVVTTCATNAALQLPVGAALPSSVSYMMDNRTANPCLIYPPSGGALGSAATNVPAYLPPGHYVTLTSQGPLLYQGFTAPHRNYLIPNVTVSVPAIAANQTVNLTPVTGNSMVLVGDICTPSVVTTTTLPAGLILGGVTNTGTAGQILMRAANVQTLATTATATVTASFSCQGT